jgi:hypothetical protein
MSHFFAFRATSNHGSRPRASRVHGFFFMRRRFPRESSSCAAREVGAMIAFRGRDGKRRAAGAR